MARRIIIGISGASGVIYGVRMLQHQRDSDCEAQWTLSTTCSVAGVVYSGALIHIMAAIAWD
jgi:3-polyprenyl-4-hydroxybenzoate decarboxylase